MYHFKDYKYCKPRNKAPFCLSNANQVTMCKIPLKRVSFELAVFKVILPTEKVKENHFVKPSMVHRKGLLSNDSKSSSLPNDGRGGRKAPVKPSQMPLYLRIEVHQISDLSNDVVEAILCPIYRTYVTRQI